VTLVVLVVWADHERGMRVVSQFGVAQVQVGIDGPLSAPDRTG
jgi:hypothetical protein